LQYFIRIGIVFRIVSKVVSFQVSYRIVPCTSNTHFKMLLQKASEAQRTWRQPGARASGEGAGVEDRRSIAVEGGILAGITLLGNATLGIAPTWQAALVAGVCVGGGILLDRVGNGKIEKLFRMCSLENKAKQIPIVIKREKGTYVIHLPAGISQKHFEQHRQELEQALNAKIEFSFNKNLVMKLVPMNLGINYDYVFEGQEKPLEVFCGYTHEGKFILDIEKTPHMIVAGETNSGKSSLLRNMILSLILNRHSLDIHLIDFQAVELGIFEACKKVRSYGETPEDFERLLDELAEENDRRLKLFRSVKSKVYVQNLSVWNEKFPERKLPHKIVVIDEFSRLAEKDYELMLEKFRTRVAMDRKVGIHYIVAMQRPDVKCISGSIKANMPTRAAFKTFSQVDSEVILDQGGAEDLKQQGRFLIKYCGEFKEVQALYIENDPVRAVLKKHKAFKTREEIDQDRREDIKKRRQKCINPYLEGRT
jgi:S-DNA-T family DNA segregation ATPase FtsK/SpoIIIE